MDQAGVAPEADPGWWQDEAFWGELFDFIFPPEHLALGADVASRVHELLQLRPGADVLDLGCGPGRVCVPLARMGHHVTGVDVQPSYLARARTWAEREGLHVDLRREDVARLDYDAEYDAAISVFTSFGYFADPADDARTLAGAWRALRPGGRFLLETAHRDGVVRVMRPREVWAADGRCCREEPRFDPIRGVLETRWTVTSAAGTRRFTSRMRPYTATELSRLLHAAGFADLTFLGTLRGGPPSLDSFTVTVVARRPR